MEREKILTEDMLGVIQKRVDNTQTPKDIGRIPSQITHWFSGFTADQWKNWTLVFSLVALEGLLPNQHLACWCLFVNACSVLCQRHIRKDEIKEGERLLKSFCLEFLRLYGKENLTPNMHLHLHLPDDMLDYGPVYVFWLFSFERYNGTMVRCSTNYKQIPIQLMKQFLERQDSRNQAWPADFEDIVQQTKLFHEGEFEQSEGNQAEHLRAWKNLQNCKLPVASVSDDFSWEETWINVHGNALSRPLENASFQSLCKMYEKLYKGKVKRVTRFAAHYKSISLCGNFIDCKSFSSGKATYVLFYWPRDTQCSSHGRELTFGQVESIFANEIDVTSLTGNTTTRAAHLVAKISVFESDPCERHLEEISNYYCFQSKSHGEQLYIPVQRIRKRCAIAWKVFTDSRGRAEKVIIAIPLPSRSTA